MSDIREHSATSNWVRVLLKNSSTGVPLTGLAYNSSGLIISTICDVEASATAYTVAGSNVETISTLGTFAAPSANKCRFKEVDATNHPGIYEIQIADARFSVANAKRIVISWSGATNLLSGSYEIVLDPDVNTNKLGGTAQTGRDIGASVLLSAGTGTGQLDFTSGVVKSNLVQILATALTETAGYLAAGFKKFFNIASPTSTMNQITLVDTTTTNTDMRGTDSAALASELAKVPKSDGSTTWNATAVAQVQSGLATSTEVTAIQNNTRVVRVVPTVIERPDSGTVTYRIELLLYDATGNMEAPDSAPTIALVDQGGTDLSARLDSATMALVSTGRYRATYTATSTDDLEQLVWTFSVVEGGATRLYGNTSLIVDTSAVDFTAADRTKLESLHSDWVDGGRLDLLIDAILEDTGTSLPALMAASALRTALGLASANLDTQLGNLPTNAELAAAVAAVTATGIDAATATKIADYVLRRGYAAARASSDGDAVAFRSLLGAIAKQVNKIDASGGSNLLIKHEDDSTTFGTQAMTGDAGADPIVTLDRT